MTQLAAAIAALLDPPVEHLTRDTAAARGQLTQLAAAHLADIRHLRAQHAAARRAHNPAGMRRAINAMARAGHTYRTQRTTLTRALHRDTATAPSLLDQLHDAVHSTAGAGSGSRGVHRSPLNAAAVELLTDIAHTLDTPVTQLAHALRTWHPDDEHTATEQATAWATAAEAILDPPRSLEGTRACPACGTRFVWTTEGDERVRRAAIRIVLTRNTTDDYAECLAPACRTRWERARWNLLAAAMQHDQPS